MRQLIFEPIKYSGRQFAVFRFCLGLYLFIYFTLLYPYVGDLYANAGMYSFHPEVPFPGLELLWGERSHGQISLIVLATCAVLFAAGFQRRLLAFALWFGWTSLLLRLPFFTIPSECFVGWMILATVAIPSGEPWALSPKRKDWKFPTPLYWAAWILLGVGYSISGYDKCQSLSWINGTALRLTFESPVANTSAFKEWILLTPPWFLQLSTWGALALETLYAPLVLFRALRPWAWLAMVLMHLIILLFIDVESVSCGMLLMHLFVFDPRWIGARRTSPQHQTLVR